MTPSLRALLDGIIDYAGLFPPARLPLPEAAANFVRYQPHPQAFMLSRFICPAGQLAALSELPAPSGGWRLSVLIAPGEDQGGWMANARSAVDAIGAFVDRATEPVDARALELRLPAGTAATPYLEAVGELAPDAQPYFEITLSDDVDQRLDDIAAYNARRPTGVPTARAKIRTGGVEASMFPTAPAVADFIVACRQAGVAFKATAGLHHPLRHFNDSVSTDMHGFLNVFVAAVLAFDADAGRDALIAALEDRDAAHFGFEADRLTYGGHAVDAGAIARVRQEFVAGYGSCSFDEPVEDLAALNLL